MISFEDFLKEKHAADYHGTDDDMPDAFEAWLERLQIDEMLHFGQLAMMTAEIEGIKHGGEISRKAIREGLSS